ncbi:methylated-DNA--[protein]-cysteine S-methyltransferase [Pseudoclavibacter sp. RFBA6]|uniref:methylated-DNA--[protein]-cysteine S-methyltransferase n=1 Tax=Pseudoclavibacter sp. RFBA6 TaxID=2080573 RepID=UPI000CE8A55C|nr:methylated-DNA--[protein]-cysteine S-methyltransferase [Pseudoclavibacter sp. RFBA6]PPG42270.1 methylated-DNA--protein-cysteine methyltransferase [Pseudoclavibacter sp. RFBA6]
MSTHQTPGTPVAAVEQRAVIETFGTPDGPFTIVARESDGAVLSSGWSDDEQLVVARITPRARPMILTRRRLAASDAVRTYYDGELDAIDDVPVAQFGAEFRMQGWRGLRDIAAGHPLTYTEFATALGRPTAVRAAASICASNAPALFVPCHRVLRSDGTLGGFAWGVDVKRSLLQRELAHAA